MKFILSISLLITLSFTVQATVWTVDSLNNAGIGSLRVAVDSASNGDTIRFNPNLISGGSDSIVLSTSIGFSKSLTFKGLYTTTDTLFISGGGNDRIFRIDSLSKLVVDSMVLINGFVLNATGTGYADNGGAILLIKSDSLIIANSIIRNNTAQFQSGGGIYAPNSGYIELINSSFSGNNGGGVWVISQTLLSLMNVSNSTFINNSGVGLYYRSQSSSPCNFQMTNSSLSYNDEQGLAITNTSGYSTHNINISNSTLRANNGGGAYFNLQSHSIALNLDSMVIDSNNIGGLIVSSLHDSTIVNVSNSIISDNTYKGGIRCSRLHILNSLVNNNTSTVYGGGIFVYKTLFMDSCTVTNNVAGEDGGGVYGLGGGSSSLLPGNLHIENSTVSNNVSGENGGGVCSIGGNKSIISLNNSNISNNICNDGKGGGVFGHSLHSTINIMNSIINNNSSFGGSSGAVGGGGVASESSSNWSPDTSLVNVENSIISNNNIGGGIFCSSSHNTSSLSSFSYSELIINNSQIDSNNSIWGAGGVGNSGSTTVTFIDSTSINSNTASSSSGGGIFVNGISIETTINNSTISFNSASGHGGGFASNSEGNTILELNSTTINNNDCGVDGGGIHCFGENDTTSLIIEKSTICNNVAVNGGGICSVGYTFATSNSDGYMDIVNTTLFNNIAVNFDNIYSSFDSSNVSITGSIVQSNDTQNIFNSDSPLLTSGGYNIFSDSTLIDTVFTDQLNIDSTLLNLDTLAFNGGFTKTLLPLYPSVAINMGNPLDFSNAQNGPIIGVRDVGAAEKCTIEFSDAQSACINYTWMDGITYTASNDSAVFSIIDPLGCDSIYYLDLVIGTIFTVDTHVVCDSLTWIDGITYYSSNNTAKDTLISYQGCDSIVTLNLLIANSNTVDTILGCDSLTWVNGITYYANNYSAIDTLINAFGCDSVVTLNLTMNYSSTGIDSVVTCDSLTWIDGITYTVNNNTAVDTIVNAAGCDSIVTLNLTIIGPSLGVDTHIVCDSFTWLDGITYTSSTDSAIYVISGGAVNGCDSIVTLDLTITNSTGSTEVISACESYTWMDGITYYASNNTATFTVSNSIGCDSIIALNLTITYPPLRTDVITSCGSYTWIDGNTYNTSNNTATYVISNSVGCDSVITLDLTIINIDTSVVEYAFTLSSQATNSTFQWINCATNTPIPNETQSVFVVTQIGDYAVEVSQNGCVDTSSCFTFINVSVDEVESEYTIEIYPNPTLHQLNIETENFEITKIQILDNSGKVVKTITTNFEIVNVESLATGVYHLELIGESEIIKRKFIKN